MDCARAFTTVKDLRRRTQQEVAVRDGAYDRLVLLNESKRPLVVAGGIATARPWTAAADESEAAKQATETWADYGTRVVAREEHLLRYFREAAATERAAEEAQARRSVQSAAAVRRVMAAEEAAQGRRFRPARHTLRIDFAERQDEKMRGERRALEGAATEGAAVQHTQEAQERRTLEVLAGEDMHRVLAVLEQRQREREADDERRAAERRRQEEMRQAEEERRKREAEAAERQRREAEEEAKRLERKRREDERKAKAKAEREQRQRAVRSSISHDATAAPAGPAAS